MTDPTPGILSEADLLAVQALFGVDEEQVRRDHVISHALAALSRISTADLVFFGGTALSRTHLPKLRLSEDIDLIAMGDRRGTAEAIQAAVVASLRRRFATPRFSPDLVSARGSQAVTMTLGEVTIRVQLLSRKGYPRWPVEVRELHQRYSDAPPARMTVPTASAFAASKLAAWSDRHASRDLYDLWGLAEKGLIDAEARELFARFGPFTDASKVSFDAVPTEQAWDVALGHQGIVRVSPDEAAAVVRGAWAAT